MLDFDSVVVRYGEIFLKSEAVRSIFMRKLVSDVKDILERERLNVRVSLKRHRIYLRADAAVEVAGRVSRVFGVSSTSPAVAAKVSLQSLMEVVAAYARGRIMSHSSFAVRAHRTGAHAFSSKDLEVALGDVVRRETGAGVDLTSPDTTIYVEVYDNLAFIFDLKFPGVGGLPYGTQGRVLAVMGDERSLLAAWMMMRRGCEVLPFYSRYDGGFQRVLDYFSPRSLDYRVGEVGGLEGVSAFALREGCLGVVSGGGVECLCKTKNSFLPFYLPLTGLLDGEVEARLRFLRSCVK